MYNSFTKEIVIVQGWFYAVPYLNKKPCAEMRYLKTIDHVLIMYTVNTKLCISVQTKKTPARML